MMRFFINCSKFIHSELPTAFIFVVYLSTVNIFDFCLIRLLPVVAHPSAQIWPLADTAHSKYSFIYLLTYLLIY